MNTLHTVLAALPLFGTLGSPATGTIDCIRADVPKATQPAQPRQEAKPVAKPAAVCPCKTQQNLCPCNTTSRVAAQPVHIDLTCPTPPVVTPMPLFVPIVGPTQPKIEVPPPQPPAPEPPKKSKAPVAGADWIKTAAVGIELVIVIMLLAFGVSLLNARTLERATEGLVFRRYWGGFGGEGSGWHMSAPLAKCLAGLLLISLGAALTAQAIWVVQQSDDQLQASNDDQPEAAQEVAPQIDTAMPPEGVATTASTSTNR